MAIEIPEKALFLITVPSRYKVLYGGRGGYKSWSAARAIILKMIESRRRILCTRQIQKSIRDSVHKLLVDQIVSMGFEKSFRITDADIKCVNGSEVIFEGLHNNVKEIKSKEGIDIVWAEEAESITNDSWDILIPTIRKPLSEIWITFNTGYEFDDTFQRFVINKPDNCIVQQTFYYENSWLPDVLRKEAEDCKKRDPEGYRHIWLGDPKGGGGRVWAPYVDTEYPQGHVRVFDWGFVRSVGNCFMAMDPNDKYLPFCVWGALIPKNSRNDSFYTWIYNEWPDFSEFEGYYAEFRKKRYFADWGSLFDLAKIIYAKDQTKQHGLMVQKRFIDTRFAKGSGSAAGWSSSTLGIVEEFAKPANGGLVFELPFEKLIDIQHKAILEELRWNKAQEVGPFNESSIFVAPWCRNMRQMFSHHRCEENSEKESERNKDASDTLRILKAGLVDWRYKDPSGIGKKENRTVRQGEW